LPLENFSQVLMMSPLPPRDVTLPNKIFTLKNS